VGLLVVVCCHIGLGLIASAHSADAELTANPRQPRITLAARGANVLRIAQENYSPLNIDVLEQTVFELVNQHRISEGLVALEWNDQLSEQARSHSQAMAQREIPLGHVGLQQRAEHVNRIIRFRQLAENVAYIFSHQNTAGRAVQGWLRSPSHRAAIEGDYRLTGIGVAQGAHGAFFFTQFYLRPR
jgi:uncharacterized protein YkwD